MRTMGFNVPCRVGRLMPICTCQQEMFLLRYQENEWLICGCRWCLMSRRSLRKNQLRKTIGHLEKYPTGGQSWCERPCHVMSLENER